jgi:ArsR family transcriptional regulator
MAGASAAELAEALASVTPYERRAVLDEADRLRRQKCCGDVALPALIDADRARQAAEVAKALADPARLQIFQLLREHGQEICQCDIQPLFDLSQPTLSHHLRKLVAADLVCVERRGKWAYYTIDNDTLEVVKKWLS